MDIERARFNMVEQQIRTWEVLNQETLDLLYIVRREEYVPPAYRSLAFIDMEIPLGFGETMMPPKMEARILQEIALKKTDTVLEVGSGSGYMTALLARCARHVYSVEIRPQLKDMAERNLRIHDVDNVTLELGDAARGWSNHAPYDAIVLTGSTPLLPNVLLEQLKVGGRLFAIVGDPPVMEARLITSVAPGAYNTINLFETCVTPLVNAAQPARFTF